MTISASVRNCIVSIKASIHLHGYINNNGKSSCVTFRNWGNKYKTRKIWPKIYSVSVFLPSSQSLWSHNWSISRTEAVHSPATQQTVTTGELHIQRHLSVFIWVITLRSTYVYYYTAGFRSEIRFTSLLTFKYFLQMKDKVNTLSNISCVF